MTRRPKGTGSIRERKDGVWEGIYTDPTGKRKSIYGKTKKIVKDKLDKITSEIKLGEYVFTSNNRLSDWLSTWLSVYVTGVSSYSEHTWSSYESDIRNHIVPSLGNYRLSALSPSIIQKFINGLSQEQDGHKALSAKTVRDIHGTLHRALADAVKYKYISENPADNCKLPKAQEPLVSVMKKDDLQKFLISAEKDDYYLLFLLAFATGMRQGEILGLTWDCIDFEAQSITIKQQLMKQHTKDGKYFLSPTKNKKSRIIQVPSIVIEKLKQHKIEQNKYKELLDNMWSEEIPNLVFTQYDGTHLSHTTVYKHFKRIADSIGLPNARFHDARHTYAVNSLINGDQINTVQKNLGHYSSSFTYDRYCHVLNEMQVESANKMNEFLTGMIQQ